MKPTKCPILLVLFLVSVFAGVTGVHADEVQPFDKSRVSVVTERGRFDFAVEMATTPEQRTQGLQGRRKLAPTAGMLFDFETTQPVYMWMKNTVISLDMLFIDDAGTIANIAKNTVPLSLAVIPSARPVRAVLELNGGAADRTGIKPGDRVIHAIFGNDDGG